MPPTRVELGQDSIGFWVRTYLLVDQGAYRLTVRAVDAAPEDPLLLEHPFQVVFGPPTTAFCDDLDPELEHANDLQDEGHLDEASLLYRASLNSAVDRNCLYQQARARSGLGVLASKAGRLRESVDHLRRGKKARTNVNRSE